jgi:peptidase E
MERVSRQIVAMGGGGFSMEPENPALDAFVLSLARAARPRVCFVPTASGDSESYVRDFYRAFAAHDCRPADLALFERTEADLRAFLLAQDVIYVGGGSTANLLAVWRVHGLDAILRAAWEEGVVLCGVSAGMNCWFESSVTDSWRVGDAGPLRDGLGLLPGSACPHYDGEPARRPAFRALVDAGELPPGLAADDGAALVFSGTELEDVVASRDGAAAYAVGPGEERRIGARRL